MALFWKICAGVLLAVVVLPLLDGQKDMANVLRMAVCCIAVAAALSFLRPVLELIHQIAQSAEVDTELLAILLKSAGIGLLSEIAALICQDTGNASLGKTLQLTGTLVILWLSIPLFTCVLELIRDVLGEI